MRLSRRDLLDRLPGWARGGFYLSAKSQDRAERGIAGRRREPGLQPEDDYAFGHVGGRNGEGTDRRWPGADFRGDRGLARFTGGFRTGDRQDLKDTGRNAYSTLVSDVLPQPDLDVDGALCRRPDDDEWPGFSRAGRQGGGGGGGSGWWIDR